jgi:outer membrane protein assembly factor BamB
VQPGGSFSSPGYATNANGTPVLVFGSVDPDNSVYALNARTGAKVWTYRTNKTTANDDVGAAPTISAPGVNGFADGVVYITGKDKVSTIYLGSDTGVYALNATTGATVWHVITNRAFYASPAIVGPPGQQVLITANITGHIYALDLATGETLWTQTADSAGIWSSPAVSQNTIYITGKDGQLVTFTPSGAKR